jgi:hypothetical protein
MQFVRERGRRATVSKPREGYLLMNGYGEEHSLSWSCEKGRRKHARLAIQIDLLQEFTHKKLHAAYCILLVESPI